MLTFLIPGLWPPTSGWSTIQTNASMSALPCYRQLNRYVISNSEANMFCQEGAGLVGKWAQPQFAFVRAELLVSNGPYRIEAGSASGR
jgi:hypothetical protein